MRPSSHIVRYGRWYGSPLSSYSGLASKCSEQHLILVTWNISPDAVVKVRKVDQTIFDKTTQCIMLLTASRLRSPELPGTLTKEIEMSRVELSESTRNRPALRSCRPVPISASTS